MNYNFNITDIAGVFISLCSLLFTAYVYFAHVKKIEQLQYEQLKKEQQKEKQAKFCIGKEKNSSKLIVRFMNIGESDAYNIAISLINTKEELEKLFVKKTDYSFDAIYSRHSVEIGFHLLTTHPDILNFKVTWDDAFQKNNQKILMIQI